MKEKMNWKRLTFAIALGAASFGMALPRAASAAPVTPPTGPIISGFDANTLPANDDGSTGVVNLPFPIDFFGNTYNSLYVNNNGNVTFNNPLSTFTPSGLTTFGSPIIAPFWADVDTAVSGSNLVTYGPGTVSGHQAFGVNWPGVDCFDTTGGGLNYFQLLLIDRSDIATGDFDIEFNYAGISWDSGTASGGNGSCRGGTSAAAGYTNGSSTALELAGSFVNNAFIDGGPNALASGSQNSVTPGRYIFPVRAGSGGSTVAGTVADNATPANPVGGALVSICGSGANATSCYLGNTGTDGSYSILGVPDGSYVPTVSPPSGSALNQLTGASFTVTGPGTTDEDFTLTGPTPPPNGTVVTGVGNTTIGGAQVPVVYWESTSPISTHACSGGTVTAAMNVDNTAVPPVPLTENPAGSGIFTGTLPAVHPLHGAGTVTINITNCPNPAQDGPVSFSIYVDPSGLVVDGNHGNAPVSGATVTLLASDSLDGTYTAVPNGSAVMSPANRANPDTSHADGSFGWDTTPGFYEVTATKAGCGTATTPGFQVPPPNASLQLVLHCGSGAGAPPIGTGSGNGTPTTTTVAPTPTTTAPPTTTPTTPTTTPKTNPLTSAPAVCSAKLPSGSVVGMAQTADGGGYWIASSNGQVVSCGDAPVLGNGSPGTVAIAGAPIGNGYWLVTGTGQVSSFGSAMGYGSVPATVHLNGPIVAMAADPATGGYWLLGSDGGVFSYNAPFLGSTGSIGLARPAVGMEATPYGHGYRFVASDGGVFDYGDAAFYGSMGGMPLAQPVVGMANDPATGGYWLVAADGGVFSFGAPFYGSTGGIALAKPVIAMTGLPGGTGYRMVATDGGIFDFGAAVFEGSAAS